MICLDCGEEKKHKARGMCGACYGRWKRRNSPGIIVVCVSCGEEKKHYAKGLCRSCYVHCWGEQNPGRNATYCRRYHQKHQEKISARKHRYYEEHREEMAIRWARYYETHREREVARKQHYQKENPEKVITISARRRARKRSLPDTLTPEQAEQLLAIGQATYPNEKLALDHFVPIVAGGGTTFANMHAMPARLNCTKNDKLPEEIYRQLALA